MHIRVAFFYLLFKIVFRYQIFRKKLQFLINFEIKYTCRMEIQ